MDLGKRKNWQPIVIQFARQFARLLIRFEIILLSFIYIYFVVSDSLLWWAVAIIIAILLARMWLTGSVSVATPLDLPILLLLAWLPISYSISTVWWLTLPKIYGVILSVAFYFAIVNHLASADDFFRGAFWLTLVFVAIAVAGMLGTDWAQARILSATFIYERLPRVIQGIPRSIAGGFARNGIGGTLTFIIPFLTALAVSRFGLKGGTTWQDRPHKFILFFALALSMITLALTQSRGAILGTVVGLLALLIWKMPRVAWGIIGFGIAGLAILFAAGYGSAIVEFVLRIDSREGTLASRIEVWQRGLMMVQDFPFSGIGMGTYNTIAHLMYPFFIAAPDELVPHAHNNFLQVAVDLGIPGLIAYSGLMTGFIVCLARADRAIFDNRVRAILAGLGFGMLAHQVFGLTDAFMLGSKPGLLMWIFLAFAAASFLRRNAWQKELN